MRVLRLGVFFALSASAGWAQRASRFAEIVSGGDQHPSILQGAAPPLFRAAHYTSASSSLRKVNSKCTKADDYCCLADALNEVNPVLGLAPFLFSCPKMVNASSLCEALNVDPELVKPSTTLLPVQSYTVPTGKLLKTKTYGYAYQAFPYVPEMKNGTASDGMNPPITDDGVWIADTSAAIVAIGSPTGCYNIYGAVHPGDELEVSCTSNLINDPTLVVQTFFNGGTIFTAGNLNLAASTAAVSSILQGVFVGGNLEVLSRFNSAFSLSIAVNSPFTAANLVGTALAVLGDLQPLSVAPDDDVITIVMGGVVLSSPDDTEFIDFQNTPAIIIPTPEELLFVRAVTGAILCSAATQFEAAAMSGSYSVSGTTLSFFCDDGDGTVCFIDISGEELMDATAFTLALGEYDFAVIRVTGTELVLSTLTTTGSTNLLFAFLEAHTIAIRGGTEATINMPTFAPYAHTLQVFTPVDTSILNGPFIMGNSKSTTMFTNFIQIGSVATAFPALPAVDEEDTQVWICDCGCNPDDLPTKKIEKWCLNDYGQQTAYNPYFPVANS